MNALLTPIQLAVLRAEIDAIMARRNDGKRSK